MPKTTLKVRAKRWEFFNRECKVMSLRRDDLIDRVLPGELSLLEAIPPCDAVGSKWLKDRWITSWSVTDIEMINAPVMLSDPVLKRLNQICSEKSIPRDAFFDCFLEFLTGRLLDPALVIKDPRTDRDLGSQVAALLVDDELNDDDLAHEVLDAASGWVKGKNVAIWNPSLYKERLSYTEERVEIDRAMLELFLEDSKRAT